ncbi:MAG: PTS sugar transporter subunit IIB [Tetragenococcus koreensis]|nr:PTS sugar transporter subunit IIB [Tetragenococcus koreensis]
MNILTVCGMGFGTSLMLFMEIQKIAKEEGYKIDGEATDISNAKGRKVDLIVASSEIASQLSDEDSKIIPINNILDNEEIKNKVLPEIKTYYENMEE